MISANYYNVKIFHLSAQKRNSREGVGIVSKLSAVKSIEYSRCVE